MASPRETLGRDQNVRPDVELTGGATFGSTAQGTSPVHLEARMDALVESSSPTAHTITLTTRGAQGATYTRPLAAGGSMLVKGRGNQSLAIDAADASVVFVTGPAGTLWPANPSVGGGAATVAVSMTAAVNITPNANAAFLMAGLASGTLTKNLIMTPTRSGLVKFTVCGVLTIATANDISGLRMRYGTGGAPAQYAAETGTQLTYTQDLQPVNTGNVAVPFCLVGYTPKLTLGTAYWFDVSTYVTNDSNDTVLLISAAIEELNQ